MPSLQPLVVLWVAFLLAALAQLFLELGLFHLHHQKDQIRPQQQTGRLETFSKMAWME